MISKVFLINLFTFNIIYLIDKEDGYIIESFKFYIILKIKNKCFPKFIFLSLIILLL